MRENIEYTTIYEETANTNVYYHSLGEDIRGYLPGKKVHEIFELERRIHKCKCGANAELHEWDGMGDGDYRICCSKCERNLIRSPYDVDIHKWDEVLDACIRDWNAGLLTEDIKKMNKAEHERVRLREEDLVWYNYYPNNMKGNGIEGCYSLVFREKDGKIYCCKWTILYQKEECEPGGCYYNAPIDAYNLFKKVYHEVKGPMNYPNPEKKQDLWADSEDTFTSCDVNDEGDFVRSYRSLEEAKNGAVGRCGWQGLDRDTILREEEYSGQTAEEVLAKWKKEE